MQIRFKYLFLIFVLGHCFIVSGCGLKEEDERLRDYERLNPQRDFTLKDQNGNIFRLKDHRDQIVLLFFGYISCPDVCPTTLSKLAKVYSALGDKRQQVLTVFVSVDAERDTPEKIKEYLEYFNVNAVGLTGTETQIDDVVLAYKVYYEKVNTTSALGYMINHTDYLFLIDHDGKVRYLFRPEDKAEKIVQVIREIK